MQASTAHGSSAAPSKDTKPSTVSPFTHPLLQIPSEKQKMPPWVSCQGCCLPTACWKRASASFHQEYHTCYGWENQAGTKALCRSESSALLDLQEAERQQAQSLVVPSHFVTVFLAMSNVTFRANDAGVFVILRWPRAGGQA